MPSRLTAAVSAREDGACLRALCVLCVLGAFLQDDVIAVVASDVLLEV